MKRSGCRIPILALFDTGRNKTSCFHPSIYTFGFAISIFLFGVCFISCYSLPPVRLFKVLAIFGDHLK